MGASALLRNKGLPCPICSKPIPNCKQATCGKRTCVSTWKRTPQALRIYPGNVPPPIAEPPISHKTSLWEQGREETIAYNNDRCEISLPKTRIQTLDELLEHCKVDQVVWKVDRFVVNKWEMGAKDETGIIVEPLFQVKAWLSKKTELVNARAELEALKDAAKKLAPVYKVKSTRASGNHMLELSIPDLHVGKLAWAKETGWENYDVEIAERVYWDAFETLLQRCAVYSFDKILFVVGNDLLNSDNLDRQTTKGTAVTTDVRFHRTFSKVREMMVQSIERLREYAPVEVVMVPGNHDTLSVWHLGDSLECWFHNCGDVTIENSPLPRKYVQYGNTMLMFTHGHEGQRADFPLLMATEKPEMFGATLYREAHTGHIHQTRLEEKHGVRVRILPALCAADEWHSVKGYVGNLRSAEAYVWHKSEGLVNIAMYTWTKDLVDVEQK